MITLPYKNSQGQWILDLPDGTRMVFATEAEALVVYSQEIKMSQKKNYVTDTLTQANALAAIMEAAPDLLARYFDCGYNGGGANEIVDADLVSFGITAAQFVAFITCLENYGKFCQGTNPANAQYRVSINQVRQ